MMIPNHPLPMTRQCQLLDLARSSFYYREIPINPKKLELMNLIDKIHLQYPFFGCRKIRRELLRRGFSVCREQVSRLMRELCITAVCPKPRLSKPHPDSKIYPYLLNNLEINRANQVWSTDITYIPMAKGFCYLVAIIDIRSRKVLSWKLSNTQDTAFCLDALEEALQKYGKPEIFNTDQGSQFTSDAFTRILKDHEIKISMDGKGRWIDNVFIERLWRSVKYEEVYLKSFGSMSEAKACLAEYFEFYNQYRCHQSLDYRTPDQVYWGLPQEKLAA